MASFGIAIAAALLWPQAAQAPDTHPACAASIDPQRYEGREIEDRLLIIDVSPHGFGYFSRYCGLNLATIYADGFPRETASALFRQFYAQPRDGETGPRVVEAVVRGWIERHDFGDGDDTTPPGERWVLRIASISEIALAPEATCALVFNPELRWIDCPPVEAATPKE